MIIMGITEQVFASSVGTLSLQGKKEKFSLCIIKHHTMLA
jgi:hypothetical protein